jgi:predicted naringenin-chalcone synthase
LCAGCFITTINLLRSPEVCLTTAYVNRIATAVPPHDVHEAYSHYALSLFAKDKRAAQVLRRMIERSGIEHRYSCLAPMPRPNVGEAMDAESLYVRGRLTATGARMRAFERHAPELAAEAIAKLNLGADRDRITHLLVTSCTGLSAPGLDIDVIERCRLPTTVERTTIGFMGCYAAISALKVARHIVRSEPEARVLMLNLELCTLHFQETRDIPQLLCFLQFADGCAASLVSAEPHGIALNSFKAMLLPNTRELMSWNIGDTGFDMVLAGQVPAAIHDAVLASSNELLAAPGGPIDLWAVHAGGRSILDAVERALKLAPTALAASRKVLRRYGNMSSATVMFVLEELLRSGARGHGCAMSFGPGLVAETMLFCVAG